MLGYYKNQSDTVPLFKKEQYDLNNKKEYFNLYHSPHTVRFPPNSICSSIET